MKKITKRSIFIALVSVFLAALTCFASCAVILTVQNYRLEKRVASVMASVDDTNSLNAEITAENEATQKENEALKKENADLKQQLEASKKEVADKQKLLDNVNLKNLIAAEKVLAAQNSPQETVISNSKVCYLTFDDGPSDRTLEILKVLDEYDAKATFFVIGTSKLQYLPQIVEKGHAIGLHSNTHKYDVIYKSTDSFFEDLNSLSDKVYDIVGIRSKVIRFPGGSSNGISKQHNKGIMTRLTSQVQIKGYAYFDWNVDSGDAANNNVTADKIVNNVLSQAANKNSICVLMHDLGSKKATVEALPEILKGLRGMGYRFEALNETVYGYHHAVKN